jgi:putative FmdB family regulatory protein
MPTYSYQCHSCEYKESKVLHIVDYDRPCKEPCPSCGALTVVQVVSTVGYNREVPKPTGDFKEVIAKIKEREPHHNLPNY